MGHPHEHTHAEGHAHGQVHGHAHGHTHDHRGANRRRLKIVLALIGAYMLAEVAGGVLANSLALLADAGHMLSDAAALALALFAMWIATRPPHGQRTFGYYRTEILAALANGATLVAISLFIFVEAWERFRQPPQVQGGVMMAIAVGGLLVNLAALWVLHGGRGDSLNMRGAWLHVVGDALGSVGAIAAGALVLGFGWYWADPLASVVIGLLILYSAWGLLKETVGVLMMDAPVHVDVDEVRSAIAALPEVRGVHDLHVWTITSGLVSLSAHVEVGVVTDHCELLGRIRSLVRERFGIEHSTIQVEPEEFEKCLMPV